ncbi:MAG TPA: amidohydrolase family protein [Terriglobales bacterium]|nr:amidohydrolase family protein [Terriglobales bacterium]
MKPILGWISGIAALQIVLWFALSAAPIVGSSASPPSIAFTNVRIVDGNGGAPIEHGTIVIEGRKITAVGPTSNISIPPGAHSIDEGGKTALPGLADMHVHLTGGWDGISADMLGYHRYMNALLYAGVTTVLDTGNIESYVLQLRAETAAGRLLGPRIYCVGPLVDGPDPFWPELSRVVVSQDQVPRLVRQLAAEKVDLIKLYAGLSDLEVQAISTEAKKYNLRTIIDAHRRNGSIELMQGGIAGYAHLPTHKLSDEAIATASAKHVFFISTLSVIEAFSWRRFQDLSFLDHPLIVDTTPAFALTELRRLGHKEVNPSSLAALLDDESNVKRLIQAGILIAAGTDAPYPGDFQGEGIHRELELLVESGLTPLEAITIATKNAALIVNAAQEWGTLEPGKLADLVIVNGKPDQTIRDTRNIVGVVREGTILDRDQLKLNPDVDPGYRPVGGEAASDTE